MTEDGGRHWKAVPLHVEPDVIEVRDASRVSDSVGFVLRREELLRTVDDGRTWVSVVNWSH